jgi:ATP-dependent Clp protease ATP-binding subunit ClpA
MQVLSRRTKNNPVLIGEPGVGKTAIVEGLARKIVSRTSPDAGRQAALHARPRRWWPAAACGDRGAPEEVLREIRTRRHHNFIDATRLVGAGRPRRHRRGRS